MSSLKGLRNRALVALSTVFWLGNAANADSVGSYFAVIVSDLEQSQTWYSSTLNLKEVSRLTDENGRYDIVNLSGEGVFVELLQLQGAAARPEGSVNGPFKMGILVTDLDGFVNTLPIDSGRPEVIRDERNGLGLIQLRDPDGNIVQIMALDRPRG